MGHPAEKRRRATYADLVAVPRNQIAEIIGGDLQVQPRPSPRHARASSALGGKLAGPFDFGEGGPGGWWILDEPEIHFPDPNDPDELEALVPDLAGWRRERMPELPETAYFALAPDWICEVLSPRSTEERDREDKMQIYAHEGVRHAWLVDPISRVLEVYALTRPGKWSEPAIYRGAARVKAAPFDAFELDLSALWAK